MIPNPQAFRTSTAPGGVFTSYGKNMGRVLAGLEAYWENGQGPNKLLKEQLLYTLWKECRWWLKKKEGKTKVSNLFVRRKEQVETLRDEAFAELVRVSGRVGQALQRYQDNKPNGGLPVGLKSLDGGYDRERIHYMQSGKKSGSSVSQTGVEYLLRSGLKDTGKFAQKGFGNLSVDDALKLERMFPRLMQPVVFLNKLARLQYLVSAEDGLLSDLNENPILMTSTSFGKLKLQMYAMDKYGNLYTTAAHRTNYVESNGKRPEIKESGQWNHSSFLAGSAVMCAGCLHIGYNCGTQTQEAGWLSAIDNNSGHYKPSSENLRNCLLALLAQGVKVNAVRVTDCSSGQPVCYWGDDFLAGRRNPWPSDDQAPAGPRIAPPVGTDTGIV